MIHVGAIPRFFATMAGAAALCSLLACGEGTDVDIDLTGGLSCNANSPCPQGQYCWNGICINGCLNNSTCAADQYCSIDEFFGEGVCVNKEVPTCSENSQCETDQICQKGYCVAKPQSTSCTPRIDGQDGCNSFSLCFYDYDIETEQESTLCYAFPPCPEDGKCPAGQVGAVCNEGDITNKARICLTGMCKSQSDCPTTAFKCILMSATLGLCSDGSFGDLCEAEGDCKDGLTCEKTFAGEPGICIEDMSCAGNGGTCADFFDGCPDDTSQDVRYTCPATGDICCL